MRAIHSHSPTFLGTKPTHSSTTKQPYKYGIFIAVNRKIGRVKLGTEFNSNQNFY
jgi:hypothetical protein